MSVLKFEKVEDLHLPIEIESEELSYSAFRQVVTYHYREEGSDQIARREIIRARHAVAVVVFDPQLDRLVMIRQFRLGAQLGTGRGFTAEIVAGLIDPGEDPRETALRELTEETGLTATKIEYLCEFLTTPGMTDEVLHLFYAEADASALTDKAGAASETEETFPFLLTFEEAMEAVDNNAVCNGIVMIGLMWFARHRNRLTGAGS